MTGLAEPNPFKKRLLEVTLPRLDAEAVVHFNGPYPSSAGSTALRARAGFTLPGANVVVKLKAVDFMISI